MTITRELIDTAIVAVIILGSAFAAVRLYADFTRRLPPDNPRTPPPTQEPTDDA